MSDPYRFTQIPSKAGRSHEETPQKPDRHPVRAVLWVLVICGAVANALTSLGGFHPLISVVFGLLTVLCIVLLVTHHLRHRR